MTTASHDGLAAGLGCIVGALCAVGVLMPTRASAASLPPLTSPARGFLSSEAAETWEHGLIAGNGTLGANVFGRPLDETIILTHERMFLPAGKPMMPPPDTGIRLFEIRRLIDRGLYRQATRLAFQLSGQDGFRYPDPFVPAFDVRITMGPGDASARGPVRDYGRSVDFAKGLATVHWADGRGIFERRLFVSRADGVVVLQIVGAEPGAVNSTLALSPRRPSPKLPNEQAERSDQRMKTHLQDVKTTADERTLTFRNTFAEAYPGSIHALEGVADVAPRGGRVTARDGALTVTGADEVIVLIAVNVIYKAEESRLEATKKRLAGMTHDFDALLKRHAAVHGPVFERMRLDLGGGDDRGLTSEQLIAASTNDRLSRALIEKQFDAGRYNILSSTGELPPTLQGVWAGTYVPSWASDFTHNGNVPSAIASMLMGNMPELMRAYTTYMESIVPYMEINARHMFGARGIVLPSRSTTNAFNNALAEQFAGGFWVAGAAWASHFFYDYYLYTGDKQFLAEHALPFMEKAALFFEDYLYEGPDGTYVFNPTQSPENTPGNTRSQGSFNATMDVAAAKELLHNLIAACRELDLDQTTATPRNCIRCTTACRRRSLPAPPFRRPSDALSRSNWRNTGTRRRAGSCPSASCSWARRLQAWAKATWPTNASSPWSTGTGSTTSRPRITIGRCSTWTSAAACRQSSSRCSWPPNPGGWTCCRVAARSRSSASSGARTAFRRGCGRAGCRRLCSRCPPTPGRSASNAGMPK